MACFWPKYRGFVKNCFWGDRSTRVKRYIQVDATEDSLFTLTPGLIAAASTCEMVWGVCLHQIMRCGSYALASAKTVVGWSYQVTPPLHSTPLHPDTIDKIKEQANKACIRCITFARANNCKLAMHSLCLILGVWDADCDSILRLYRSNEIHPNFKISFQCLKNGLNVMSFPKVS